MHTLQHSRHKLGPRSALHAKERVLEKPHSQRHQQAQHLSPLQLLLSLHRPVAAHGGTSVPTLTAGIGNAASCCSPGLTSMRNLLLAHGPSHQLGTAMSCCRWARGCRMCAAGNGHSRRCALHLHHKGRAQRVPAVGQDKGPRRMDSTWLCVLTPGNPPVLG